MQRLRRRHPEGHVAFRHNDAGGIEIELMQVYTPEELERYRSAAKDVLARDGSRLHHAPPWIGAHPKRALDAMDGSAIV